MKLDNEKENYPQYETNFQDKNDVIKTLPTDHSFTNNSEPDYGDDLVNKEFDKEKFDNENLGSIGQDQNELGREELDNDGLDDEFDNEGLDENYDDEDLGNRDQDDTSLENDSKTNRHPNQ